MDEPRKFSIVTYRFGRDGYESHSAPPEKADELIGKWDCYISPDGTFHAVKPSGVMAWAGEYDMHEALARSILRRKYGEDYYPKHSYKDQLIVGEGWASTTFEIWGLGKHFAPVCTPIHRGGPHLTEPQKQTLFAIWQARVLDMNEYFRLTEEPQERS